MSKGGVLLPAGLGLMKKRVDEDEAERTRRCAEYLRLSFAETERKLGREASERVIYSVMDWNRPR